MASTYAVSYLKVDKIVMNIVLKPEEPQELENWWDDETNND